MASCSYQMFICPQKINVNLCVIILILSGSFESIEDGFNKIQSSSSCNKSSEIAAWVLVVILLVLLIVSLVIHVMQAVWAHRKSCNRNQNTSPEGTAAMACSNPCYEASVVNLYEGKEAVRVYENFKPQ